MRLLLTGANGYLGGALAEFLKEEHEILALTRDGTGDVQADITDAAAVDAAIAHAQPDAVLHLAAANEILCKKDPELAMKINRDGTKNLVEACAARGVKKFLYYSTFHVYGITEGTITEETNPRPTHPYGITKLAGEEACKEHPFSVILRIANGIGAPVRKDVDRWSLVLLDLCRMAHEQKRLVLKTPGYQRRDFVSIKDIAQVTNILLKERTLEKIYNIGSGKSFSVREIALSIQKGYEELYGEKIALEVPEGEPEKTSLTLNINRIKKLGYKPTTSLEHVAKETLKFCEVFR